MLAIDLRQEVERAQVPVDLTGAGIPTLSRPILGELPMQANPTLEGIYASLLSHRGSAFAGVIQDIANAGGPVLYFCSAGKDRTGLVTALLLGLLGVDREAILDDFEATEANLQGAFQARILAAAAHSGLTDQQIAVNLGAPRALMETVLDRLERDGGVERYLEGHGLSAASVEVLRSTLLEP